ncbi:hypothetical protein EQH57_0147 [Dictyocoela roeselum]|nr:hypothetical protein EQH57_0147 [Dictyocoela roeselum]
MDMSRDVSRHLSQYQVLLKNLSNTQGTNTDKRGTFQTIAKIHNFLLHPGYSMLKETLSEFMDTSKFNKVIRDICTNCLDCQREKTSYYRTSNISILPKIPELYEEISIDIKGPVKAIHFKTSQKIGSFYILAICEFISKYTEIAIIADISSKTIVEATEKIYLKKHKTPKVCRSDNGRQFISRRFENLLKSYGINHVFTSAHNPTGNDFLKG